MQARDTSGRYGDDRIRLCGYGAPLHTAHRFLRGMRCMTGEVVIISFFVRVVVANATVVVSDLAPLERLISCAG